MKQTEKKADKLVATMIACENKIVMVVYIQPSYKAFAYIREQKRCINSCRYDFTDVMYKQKSHLRFYNVEKKNTDQEAVSCV